MGEWFKELEHYGFIIKTQHGSLGVDGKGKSPKWRLTELGVASNASSRGETEIPTNDFLKWMASCLAGRHGNRIPVPTCGIHLGSYVELATKYPAIYPFSLDILKCSLYVLPMRYYKVHIRGRSGQAAGGIEMSRDLLGL